MHRSRTINIEQMKNNRWTNEQQCIDEHEYKQLFFFFYWSLYHGSNLYSAYEK